MELTFEFDYVVGVAEVVRERSTKVIRVSSVPRPRIQLCSYSVRVVECP
jgi:hypothetical protein